MSRLLARPVATRMTVLALGAAMTVFAGSPAQSAAPPKFVAPTSVTPVGATCRHVGGGDYDVTARFKVTGGRYNNLGHPSGASAIINAAAYGNGRYDNVRAGGTRYIESTFHFYYHPGYNDETGQVSQTSHTFLYQHAVAPITKQGTYVSSRKVRILKRNIEVTFTCA